MGQLTMRSGGSTEAVVAWTTHVHCMYMSQVFILHPVLSPLAGPFERYRWHRSDGFEGFDDDNVDGMAVPDMSSASTPSSLVLIRCLLVMKLMNSDYIFLEHAEVHRWYFVSPLVGIIWIVNFLSR